MVTFLKDRAELVVIDPAVADDIEALSAVQRGELSILNRDDADRTWIVAYSVDDGPVAYYIWNRSSASRSSSSTTSRHSRTTSSPGWSPSRWPQATASSYTVT